MDPTINNLAEALKQCSAIADSMQKALKVIIHTPHIRAYLAVMDPKALEQADLAAGQPDWNAGALKGQLVELKTMRLIWDALQQFADNSEDCSPDGATPDERMDRDRIAAIALVERIEAGMVPLMERDDRIFQEEMAKERRKAAYDEH